MNVGYRLGSDWLIPDVSMAHPNQPIDEYLLGAPALAVEIVSDTDPAEYIETKVARYLSSGAHEVWVVYPKTRHVWVHSQSSHEPCDSVVTSKLLGGIAVSDLLG